MFKLFSKKKKRSNHASLSSLVAQSSSMTLSIGNAQHQGRRNYQEDSFGVSDTSKQAMENKGILAVLADGMGGLQNGKEISQQAVNFILNWFNSPETVCDDAETMKDFVLAMNDTLAAKFNESGMKSGTTLVAAMIKNGFLHWVCVGDSRLYVKRNNKLYQLNEDHDYLNQLLGAAIDGNVTFEEAFGDYQRDSLASCIGKEELELFDFSRKGFRLKDNDVILLCSDGVYNALNKEELVHNITSEPMSDAEKIKDMICSKNIPHQDNNTLILITYSTKG